MENFSTVTYGAPIKKYAQTTPSVDGVFSFVSKLKINLNVTATGADPGEEGGKKGQQLHIFSY
jgi:hypothetical protein